MHLTKFCVEVLSNHIQTLKLIKLVQNPASQIILTVSKLTGDHTLCKKRDSMFLKAKCHNSRRYQ